MRIEEVRAIVTGAASGLGYRFAQELARAGASVFAVDLHAAGLDRLTQESRACPGRVYTSVADVADEAAVRAFVQEAFHQLDGVNTLVNNAGVLLDGLLVKEEEGWIKRLPAAQWKRVLDVNLTGAFLVAREFAAGILDRSAGGGLIVNLSSMARAGNVGQSSYAASKAGLDATTRTWALELAPHGIRVAGIAPGVIETPILDNISEEAKQSLRAGIPLGRFGTPHEVWLTLKYIIECDYFTGRIVEVDGGGEV
ncbi:MAG TPA: SDR family NAD(P)-dependent oxidoreductase [Longimicrobiaceae bacterium]|nr:SDR family NAD(P)-dependent oxidoreductase [Longimicrobiaceae bacterium]